MKKSIKKVLACLEKQSKLERSRAVNIEPDKRMLAITPDTAEFFHSLLVGIKAKKILELGTSAGYSTLWFADALLANHVNPKITTIERNPIKINMAKKNFERANVSKIIKIKHGEILNVLKKMPKNSNFDFILIDADKENVVEYFDLVLSMVKIGGIIATDNVLYPKKYQRFMKKYTQHIKQKNNVRTGTIPIGYGEEISIRVS